MGLSDRVVAVTGRPSPARLADEDGWIVEIDGAPRVRMSLQVLDPVGRPEKSKAIQYAVAGPVVRAIDDVCAARPGSWFRRRSLRSGPADPDSRAAEACAPSS